VIASRARDVRRATTSVRSDAAAQRASSKKRYAKLENVLKAESRLRWKTGSGLLAAAPPTSRTR
jgi:hypothetical protein